ncbi:MAG: aminotransferase class IV [Novipirellula sp. JB048]
MSSSQSTSLPPPGAGDRVAYFGGAWIPQNSLTLSIDDLGFRQGVTAVERLRTYGGQAFQTAKHLDRFTQTTRAIDIAGLPARAEIANLIRELLVRNQRFVASQGEVGITLFATPGIVGANRPSFALHLNPLSHQRNEARQTEGQTLVVTDVVQPPEACWPRAAKVRSRLHYYRADRFARALAQEAATSTLEPAPPHSSDASGVLLDQDGSITETSIANLAIVENQTIYSPAANQVLAGITQAVVEELAAAAGIVWKKERLAPARLFAADEVLCMGTDTGIWFARSVLPEAAAIRQPGGVYSLLHAAFAKRTSERI